MVVNLVYLNFFASIQYIIIIDIKTQYFHSAEFRQTQIDRILCIAYQMYVIIINITGTFTLYRIKNFNNIVTWISNV